MSHHTPAGKVWGHQLPQGRLGWRHRARWALPLTPATEKPAAPGHTAVQQPRFQTSVFQSLLPGSYCLGLDRENLK